jgi:hypothetical protein
MKPNFEVHDNLCDALCILLKSGEKYSWILATIGGTLDAHAEHMDDDALRLIVEYLKFTVDTLDAAGK